MKLKKAELQTATHGYLYADGHMVLVHEKNDDDAGKVNWVTMYENIGIKCYFDTGRLIIQPGVMPFLSQATVIEAHKADLTHGSENTKTRGIAVETIILRNGVSNSIKGMSWIIAQCPGLISSDMYCNEGHETFEEVKDLSFWSSYKIKNVYYEPVGN